MSTNPMHDVVEMIGRICLEEFGTATNASKPQQLGAIDGLIYLFTNKLNGMYYVGQTIRTFETRTGEHFRGYGGARALCRAIREYGRDAFITDVIVRNIHSQQALNIAEIDKIAYYKSFGPGGYNLTKGGNSWGTPSEDTKLAMSVAASNRSEETNKAIGDANRGKTRSESTKAMIGHANRGKKRSEASKKAMSISQFGKKLREETKQAMRIAQLEYNASRYRKVMVTILNYSIVFSSIVEASEALKVRREIVSKVVRGKRKKSYGVYLDAHVAFTAKYCD